MRRTGPSCAPAACDRVATADPSKPPKGAKGAKVATVGLALSAIAATHRTACHKLDTHALEIRAAMKGIRKTYAAPQAQAEALKPVMVRGVLATLGDSHRAA
jgi:hypothetical protein